MSLHDEGTVFTEDNLLPISALQHLLFCERQCALIHIEGLWAENRLTVEGRHLHEKAHDSSGESRAGVRIARGLRMRSFHLGLYGLADVVEFHEFDHTGRPRDPPQPFPVEYKRGKPKRDHSDRVQLCAQAMCLEEMLEVSVPVGALFYGRTRRRLDVTFTRELRDRTQQAAARLHEMIAAGITPTAPRQPKCKNCSLLNLCLPDATGSRRSAIRYLNHAVAQHSEAGLAEA